MKAGDIKRLPDSELEIMQVLWGLEAPVTRARLEEAVAEIHPMAQTTLLTLVSRLAAKDFVRIDKQGRSSVYTPLVGKGDYLSSQSRRFVDKVCGGSMTAFAAALCDGGLSSEEIAELRKLLDEGSLG